MRKEELTIGSWVLFDGYPYKVTGTEKDGVRLTDLFPNWDEIEPIPITSEILEKNLEKKTFYGIYDDYFDLTIHEYSDGVYVANYHDCEINMPDQTELLSYIHELQQFLWRKGIQKEIEP